MSGAEISEVQMEWYRATAQVTRDLGVMALRTLITLNSGAFVVLLTFIGNAAAQNAYAVALTSIKDAMYLFLAGISLAMINLAFAYVMSVSANPYSDEPILSDKVAIPVYVLLALASFVVFVLGVHSIVSGVREL